MNDTWEKQRRTFEQTAEEYDRRRPGYPAALFDDIRRYADLAPEDDGILELGCGTGKATALMAPWPHRILALEPAAAMAEVAARNLADHDNVRFLTTSFEDWELERGAFGLVVCAQAWHWLDPVTRIDRLADALYAHGSAAIVANVQVTPDETRPFFERVQEVYREHAPAIAHQGTLRSPDDLPPHPLEGSDRFVDHARFAHPWEHELSSEDYVALMATHSTHAALESDVRARLHGGIAELIAREFGGKVTEHFVAMAGVARRA